MKPRVKAAYRGSADPVERIVVNIPADEATAIDDWGVPAGMPNRTAAIRHLIRKGLEAIRAEQTAGTAPQA